MITNVISAEISRNLADRLMWCGLLPPTVADQVIESIGTTSVMFARRLDAGQVTVTQAEDFYRALFPAELLPEPPAVWWLSGLGRALLDTGLDPGVDLTASEAAELMDCAPSQVRRRLRLAGDDPIGLRVVMDHLVAVPMVDAGKEET